MKSDKNTSKKDCNCRNKDNCPLDGKCFFFIINWDSLHARLNSGYEACSYKKRNTKRLKHTGNLFRTNLQLKDVC